MQKSTAKPETITIRHLAATLADGHGLPKSKMNDMLAGMVDATAMRLDRFLELFGGAEGNLFFDLDLLAGGWIAAHTCGTLAYLQDTKAAEPDAPPLLQMSRDDGDYDERDGEVLQHSERIWFYLA
jgi:hypothetical protein